MQLKTILALILTIIGFIVLAVGIGMIIYDKQNSKGSPPNTIRGVSWAVMGVGAGLFVIGLILFFWFS